MSDASALTGLLVAALGGAAIGVERQRSGHASGRDARFAGVRTFTLIGGTAGIAGWLAASGYPAFAAILAAGPTLLTIVAYTVSSRRNIDATTEAAAMVAIAAGLVAGLGWTALASGVIAVTVLLLVEKSQLHSIVARIDDTELRAAARFAAMAVVVLPLLPSGPIGPFGGIRPQQLWLLVLFFTGLSFVGYFAQRVAGPSHGYPVTGALGGIISSTNVTFTFARLSRAQHSASGPLATGTVAACTVLFVRVLVATAVLDARVAVALLSYVVAPFVVGAGVVAAWIRVPQPPHDPDTTPGNPLQFWAALQMAATFQLVLFIVGLMQNVFGAAGLLATGGVLGLTDVDALTISMSKSASTGMSPQIAAQAIAVGVLANCVMKGALAWVLGSREFGRRTAAVLIVMAIAIGLALFVQFEF
jgi:uncharacterized membrane protein (DUF4010 family)